VVFGSFHTVSTVLNLKRQLDNNVDGFIQ